MKWLGILVVALVLGATAGAEPPFLNTFQKLYSPKADSSLGKAACLTCHIAPPIRNAFGRAVEAEMAKQQVRAVSDAVLKAIEGGDADRDGWTNGQEISAGFLPGDAGSHPAGVPPTPVGKAEKGQGSNAFAILPDHRFHPLIIHFPIALFIFGVFLDALGASRKDPSLRSFALWNLGFGALASYAAVATGLWAFLHKGFAFAGLPLYHLLLGLTACTFMTMSVLIKKKNPEAGGVYWVFVGVAVTALMIGGHLGSVLVFG